MATLCLDPNITQPIFRPYPQLALIQEESGCSGSILPQKQSQITKIFDWIESIRCELVTPATNSIIDDQDFTYLPGPPKKTYKIKVKYKNMGKGIPMNFQFDD